jgi:hypothetical protein
VGWEYLVDALRRRRDRHLATGGGCSLPSRHRHSGREREHTAARAAGQWGESGRDESRIGGCFRVTSHFALYIST